MAETRIPSAEPGAPLLRAGRFFRPGATAPDLHGIALTGGPHADASKAAVGMRPAEIEEMYRLPAIAKYEDRL